MNLNVRKIVILFLLFVPFNVLGYSNKIVVGGENIGITLHSKGIMIVGTYDVDGYSPAKDAGLKPGDFINKINDSYVSNINEMADVIGSSDKDKISIVYTRDDEVKNTKLKLYKDNSDVFKTGLFVKDSITGIGTLTFIDPNTKKFGALGHEIMEQSTGKILDIKDGKIFDSSVSGIIPSNDGNPGEKIAELNDDEVKGDVLKNTSQGIFGNYTALIDDSKTYNVLKPNQITKGKAKIRTVLQDHSIKEFDVVITEIISNTSKDKNFVFEITDDELLKSTNGIIQGMSGSPIIRDNDVIGAVTHVVVNNPHMGFGIFITNMLEESEK